MPRKRICFVTGSRADFGLMQRTLAAISNSRNLKLQIVVTGMHLDRRLGHTAKQIGKVDAFVPWRGETRAAATGNAITALSKTFAKLRPDVVIVVGDRVEAFAAATAAHLMDIAVAHIHGGDRAQGQADDSLRHAITRLAHVHFPATPGSARRLAKMGEDSWRIHRVGSPGIEGIVKDAIVPPETRNKNFALLVLHPTDPDNSLEFRRAKMVLNAVLGTKLDRVVIIYPNNDPGSDGIIRCWNTFESNPRCDICKNVDRATFLGLLKSAKVLIGNSSAGIIEAASFGTPVIDIGPRQLGRERGGNVVNVGYNVPQIRTALNRTLKRRWHGKNPYAGGETGRKIADILSHLVIDRRLLRKVIAY